MAGAGIRRVGANKSPFAAGKVGRVAFSVGTEAADIIIVTVTAYDQNKLNPVAERVALKYYLSNNANGDGLATVPTGGIAVSVDGTVIEDVTDLSGFLVTNASGVCKIAITDSGTPTLYLIVVLPDGTLQKSGAITFA